MPSQSIVTKELLEQYYLKEGRTIRWIANELNLSSATIRKHMLNHDIPRRKNTDRYTDRDLTGIQFNEITAIGLSSNKWRCRKLWKCKCSCGNIVEWPAYIIIKKDAKTCGDRTKHYSDDKNPNWRGFGEIGNREWTIIQNNAKVRGLEIDITIEYIWDLFLKQDRRCALSGIELVISRDGKTASLDRINNDLGYIKGNVQWIHKDIQFMKCDHNEDYFIQMCHKISAFQRVKNG